MGAAVNRETVDKFIDPNRAEQMANFNAGVGKLAMERSEHLMAAAQLVELFRRNQALKSTATSNIGPDIGPGGAQKGENSDTYWASVAKTIRDVAGTEHNMGVAEITNSSQHLVWMEEFYPKSDINVAAA